VTGHPTFPVYVDSPLAVEATGIFLQCDNSCLDPETLSLVKQGINPIWFDGIHLSVSAADSKAINADNVPKVILSASGMCEAGRVRHHLKHNLWRAESTVLFVGYQADGSLGRNLQNGAQKVKLFGEEIDVRAEIGTLHGTSGHADQTGLRNWVHGFAQKPELVFVNHGDEDACEAFKDLLTEEGYTVEAPFSGCEYDLLTCAQTQFAEGKRIVKVPKSPGDARAKAIYDELVKAAEELLALAKNQRGRANKENSKLTDQIRTLIRKYR
jgi:metallo-beta-lactamase family protein